MQLELKEYRDSLVFEKEYNLNTKPLEIDLLIIKKEAGIHIFNEIGGFFRGHNILEYKSPVDHLNVDVLYKSQAYAALYKSYGKTVDAVKADDITVSILREAKPEGLFQYLGKQGDRVSRRYKGIYYVEGKASWFPTQIIVIRELDKKAHAWLRGLSSRLDKEELGSLLESAGRMTEKTDREMADSVLEVSIGANRQALQELMGDENMFETLMEIVEPKIDEIRKGDREDGRAEGRKEGILGTIAVLRKLKYKNEEIKLMIMEQYALTENEAAGYLKSGCGE